MTIRFLAIAAGALLVGLTVHGGEPPDSPTNSPVLYAMMDVSPQLQLAMTDRITNAAPPAETVATNSAPAAEEKDSDNLDSPDGPGMSYYNGSWRHNFKDDAETRRDWDQAGRVDVTDAGTRKTVGAVDVFGHSFAITQGRPDYSRSFDAMPDKSRDELTDEGRNEVETPGNTYLKEGEVGYHLTKTVDLSTSGLGHVKISGALPAWMHQ